MIRFADDMVFTFEWQDEAKRFYEVLPKRLAKAGLEIHTNKSQIIPADRLVALNAHQRKKHIPTFNFLGFTCYWGKSNKGFWRLKYTSRKDRFAAKLKGLRRYLRDNLNTKDTLGVLKTVIRVVRGWKNYHAVSDNRQRVIAFLKETKWIIYQWLN